VALGSVEATNCTAGHVGDRYTSRKKGPLPPHRSIGSSQVRSCYLHSERGVGERKVYIEERDNEEGRARAGWSPLESLRFNLRP
jgi:hypothetical protein